MASRSPRLPSSPSRASRRGVVSVFLLMAPLALAACPDDKPKVVDAGPPDTGPPPDAAPVNLLPVEDAAADASDAGGDADAEAGPPKKPGVVTDAAKIRACCAAIRRQATGAPELILVAGQCDALAAQAQSGSSPELAALKGMLGGRSIPGCNF